MLEDSPQRSDMMGASGGLFLLQETYNLNLTKFADGILEIPGSTSGETMLAETRLQHIDMEVRGYQRSFDPPDHVQSTK